MSTMSIQPPKAEVDSAELAKLLGTLNANDNISLKERTFLERVDSLPHTSRVSMAQLPDIAAAFATARWPQETVPPDPYYFSPTYLGLTGRRGGLHRYNRSFDMGDGKKGYVHFFFCLHPNKHDTVLIFPPIGNHTRDNLSNFINSFRDIGLDIRITRVTNAHDELKGLTDQTETDTKPSMLVSEVQEDVLDWRYPVRTFSIQAAQDAIGSDFGKIRRYKTQFQKLQDAGLVRIEEINFSNTRDMSRLSSLAGAWTSSVEERYGANNTGMPDDYFSRLISLGESYVGEHTSLQLKSSILSFRNKDVAFVVWEPPVFKQHRTACLFASQSLDQIRRLKYVDPVSGLERVAHNPLMYLILHAAEQAANDVVNPAKFMCLGGSETESMDNFKRQFRSVPQLSPTLTTLKVNFLDGPA